MKWGDWKERAAQPGPPDAVAPAVAPSVAGADRSTGIEGINRRGAGSIGLRLVAGGAVIALAAGLYFVPDRKKKVDEEAEAVKFDRIASATQVAPERKAAAPTREAPAPVQSDANYDVPAIRDSGAASTTTAPSTSSAPARRKSALELRMQSPTFEPRQSGTPAAPGGEDGAPADERGQAAGPMKVALRDEPPAKRAARYADPRLVSAPGAIGRCTLLTATSTETASRSVCIVTQPIWSIDGTTELVPRLTRIVGGVERGLSNGQRRIPMTLATGTTPEGVSIDFQALAADALGRGGLAGTIDAKLRYKLGPAILLQALMSAGTAAGGGASVGAGVALGAILGGTQSAVGEALRQGANVAPSGEANQAVEVSFVLPHALDFRSVYELVAHE